MSIVFSFSSSANTTRGDYELIADFAQRYHRAIAKAPDAIPLEFFQPQVVLKDLPRVSARIYRNKNVHARFLLDGTIRHIKWAYLLSKMYPGGQTEALVFDKDVQGHIDLLPQEDYVIDIKSVGGEKWRSVQRSMDRRHREQVLEYARLSKKFCAMIVYENRDTLDLHLTLVKEEKV